MDLDVLVDEELPMPTVSRLSTEVAPLLYSGDVLRRILHVAEHRVELPDEVTEAFDVITAYRPEDAIVLIDEFRGSLDGYILGMVLVEDGEDVELVDDLARADGEIASSFVRKEMVCDWESEAERDKYLDAGDMLDTATASRLDYRGGEKVFRHLEAEGIVGTKPIIWYTNERAGTNTAMKPSGGMNISYLNVLTPYKFAIDFMKRKMTGN